jgi:CheY-like chemotaxis protein/HPt (histidine-containing phosphotransfer) domain-containing protein
VRAFEFPDVPEEVFPGCDPGAAASAEQTLQSQLALLSGASLALAQPSDMAGQHLSGLFICAAQEFRRPLRKILEVADTLRMAPLSMEFRELPDSLIETTRRVLDCVNSFLDLIKLEEGDVTALSVAFDLELAVSDIFELLSPAAEARSLELIFSISPRLPRRVVGDPDRVRQIIRDFVESAIRHTASGHVALRLDIVPALRRPVSDKQSSEGHCSFLMRASVSSSAARASSQRRHGRPALPSPFMADERAGDASAEIQVTLAKSLVLHLGGSIQAIRNQETEETIFEIPLSYDPEIWADPPLPESTVGMTALVVGLSPLLRDALCEQLIALGFPAAEAESCDVAQRILDRSSRLPGLLFVDSGNDSGWDEFGRWLLRTAKEKNLKSPLCVALAPPGAVPGRSQLAGAGYSAVLGRAFSLRKVQNVMLQLFGAARPQERGQSGASATGGGRERKASAERDRAFAGLLSPRILAVLSGPEQMERMQRMLSNVGCRADLVVAQPVVAQAGPDGALPEPQQFGNGSSYDLAFVELTGKDGPETVRRIRQQWPAERIPLIGLAAGADSELLSEALAAGVTHLLTRRVFEGDIQAVLGQWIDRAGLHPAYDQTAVLRRCGGDEEMVEDLARELRLQMDRLSTAIRSAIGRQDQREALGQLKQLIEEATFFSASKLAGSARKLEQSIAESDWSNARGGLGAIRVHMLRLFEQLPARRPV